MDEAVRIIDQSLALLSRPHVLVPEEEEEEEEEDGGEEEGNGEDSDVESSPNLDDDEGDEEEEDADNREEEDNDKQERRDREEQRQLYYQHQQTQQEEPRTRKSKFRSNESGNLGIRSASLGPEDREVTEGKTFVTTPTRDRRNDTEEELMHVRDRGQRPATSSSSGGTFSVKKSNKNVSTTEDHLLARRPQTAPRLLEFRDDAVSAITGQLLTVQAQCRALEDDKAHLEDLLKALNRFMPPQPPPTQGQISLEKALAALDKEVDLKVSRLPKAKPSRRSSTPRTVTPPHRQLQSPATEKVLVNREKVQILVENAREARSQVANLKVLLSGSVETQSELEDTLQHAKQEHAKRVSELEAQVHSAREAASAARAARSPRAERPTLTFVDEDKVHRLEAEIARVKEQYLRLYEYCQEQEEHARSSGY